MDTTYKELNCQEVNCKKVLSECYVAAEVQIDVKKFHLVSGAGIRTHHLQNMSLRF